MQKEYVSQFYETINKLLCNLSFAGQYIYLFCFNCFFFVCIYLPFLFQFQLLHFLCKRDAITDLQINKRTGGQTDGRQQQEPITNVKFTCVFASFSIEARMTHTREPVRTVRQHAVSVISTWFWITYVSWNSCKIHIVIFGTYRNSIYSSSVVM